MDEELRVLLKQLKEFENIGTIPENELEKMRKMFLSICCFKNKNF